MSGSGTFLSRDAVESEPPYQYVRGNPVNWVDPSGRFPEYCRNANTKEDYALCVARHYHVLPAYDYESGIWDLSDVGKLDRACLWGGSFPYKVNGSYIEGASWYLGLTGGAEIVYDFATMERQYFTYGGGGLDSNLNLGGSGTAYIGFVHGFKSQSNQYPFSIEDYQGPFISGYIGYGFPRFASTGIIGFTSPNLEIGGWGVYASAGVSINDFFKTMDDIFPDPEVDPSDVLSFLPPPYVAGVTVVNFVPEGSRTQYTKKITKDGKDTYTQVDRGSLISDIISGVDSPLEILQVPGLLFPTGYIPRSIAIGNALGTAEIHDAVYIESKE